MKRLMGGGRWAILALVTGAHTLGAVSVLAVAPLSPLILDDLDLSRAQVGLLLPAIYLGGILMSLPAGWITDRLGARWTLAAGQLVTGAFVGVAAWSRSLPAMLLLLCAGGLGWAIVNPATGRALLDRFPARERGFAMGVKQTGLTLGGVLAALTLPHLAAAHGWRTALAIAAGASLLSAVAVAVGLPGGGGAHVGAAADPARFTELGQFLSRGPFLVLLACGLALSCVQSSVIAYLTLFARETMALSVAAAAGLLAAAQVGGTLGRLGWGVASDRLFGGRRRPGVVINACLGAATYLVFASGAPLPLPAAALVALVAGVGALGWMGLYLALAAEVGGPRHAGLLTGVAVGAAWSGVLVGPPLFGGLLQATGSYHWPWLALAAVAVVAAAALHRLPPFVSRP